VVQIIGAELLQVADAAAREKGIDREEILVAMEQAIQRAGRFKYGLEHDIRSEIDRRTGDIRLNRFREVVEDDAEIENETAQIPLAVARRFKADTAVGDFLIDRLPPVDFGRVAAQTAKQVIVQKVREAERQRQYEEFIDRVGEIVNGTVKRIDFGNVIVDLGRAEAILRRDEIIPREHFRRNDRVRALIYDVREESRGPQIFLSRTKPDFVRRLFAQEVPEVYDGVIEIRAAVRDPGSRAKMAVISNDYSLDPVGACVGMRGSRVHAVVNELQGERIDIIPWADDPATFVVNALAPAEAVKVVIDEEDNRIEVIVPDDQFSLAIGRRGQNVRLASQLTGWLINILAEGQESERRQEEIRVRTQSFIECLDVDEVIAHLLVAEGFTRVDDVAFTELEELLTIEGFDEDIAEELQRRAQDYMLAEEERLTGRLEELGVTEELYEFEGLSLEMLVRLGEASVLTFDDLADLANDELRYIVNPATPTASVDDIANLEESVARAGIESSPMTAVVADVIIMAARAHWFKDDNDAEADDTAAPGQAAE